MKIIGKVKTYNGIDIKYDYEQINILTVIQKSNIESIPKH